MHAHFVPVPFIDAARRHPGHMGVRIEERDGREWIRHDSGRGWPLHRGFYAPEEMTAEMDRRGVDAHIISIAPSLFAYHLGDAAIGLCQEANDFAADLCRRVPGRIWAMATLPLPQITAAVAEVERAARLGLVGVFMGTSIGSTPLDHPELLPLFRRTADLGLPVFLHPYLGPSRPDLADYYFVNSIGYPLETTIALARLVHGGVLHELPHLRVCLAHGGGMYPYQRGRFAHAWQVRTEPRRVIARPPADYIGGVFFDSITHDALSLEYLVRAAGEDHVLLGSDYPFDMGPADPVGTVRQAGLEQGALARVAGENAAALFRLVPPPGSQCN